MGTNLKDMGDSEGVSFGMKSMRLWLPLINSTNVKHQGKTRENIGKCNAISLHWPHNCNQKACSLTNPMHMSAEQRL
jgi:hypothetical protein